jgi:outer membrane PBP1 activator LpoA protein
MKDTNRNKTRTITHLVMISLLTASLTGCALLNNPTSAQRVQSAAKVASYVGTSEYLRTHPETRPAFEMARDSLWQLENSDTIDMALVLAIVNQLPIKELKSERATILITAATILISDYAGTIPAEEVNKLQPLVKAIREGIELGLGQRTETAEELRLKLKLTAAHSQ